MGKKKGVTRDQAAKKQLEAVIKEYSLEEVSANVSGSFRWFSSYMTDPGR
jgi:hypothetical protein